MIVPYPSNKQYSSPFCLVSVNLFGKLATMKLLGALTLAALCQSSAFNFGQMEAKRNAMQLKALQSDGDSRRDFMSKAGSAAVAIASSSGLGFGVMAPPAYAVGGAGKVNEKLKA